MMKWHAFTSRRVVPRRIGVYATQTAGLTAYTGASIINSANGVYALFS